MMVSMFRLEFQFYKYVYIKVQILEVEVYMKMVEVNGSESWQCLICSKEKHYLNLLFSIKFFHIFLFITF